MKKKLAGVLAALMVFTMGTTVSAAPSSSKESDLQKEAQELVTTVESGNSSVTLTSSVVATEDLTAVYEEVTEKIGSETGFQVLAAVEIESATALPSGGVSIKFTVSGLTSGTKNIRIYHKKSSGWEIKTPYVGNGYVSATFDSLSPFFVVKYDSTPSTSDGSEDQSSVVNNYYNTYNTYNNTNSNNTTTVNNTNSNNTTTTTNTNSNNTTTTTNTDSYNTTTTTNGKQASNKKPDSAATDTTTKKDTDQKDTSKKDTTNKDTSSGQSASANSTNDNSSKNDNSSNNTQTVTVNVGGSGSGSAKAGASTSTTSPKTGSSLPALPMIAVFLVMGIAVCGKKARNL
jgi:hypothetical protein